MFVPPARLGIHYPEKGLQRFISRLGLGVTKRILLAIETFPSHTLVDIGFVDYLVQRDNLQERSHKLAAELMQLAPLSLETMKATLNEIARGEIDSEKVKSRISLCAKSVDHQEAMRARAEKRPAVFTRQ